MSYLVLARKWRPQKFSDVVGQEHVTITLQNALKDNRVAHALLFSGPRGVGKTTVARIMAKALNCEKGPAQEPCNQCPMCRQITAGTAVDINEIDGASNRGIDEIRQLREGIRFQPVQARFRVYIIDEVHMLTREAFNAMLKTLEEPPAHAFFIMATTEPQKVPETIHSRCQHFEFKRLPLEQLASYLDKIVQQEGLGLSKEATRLLAREAGGSVRDSLSLLDQVAAFGARDIEQVCQALGIVSSQTIEALAEAVLRNDIARALELLNGVHQAGADITRLAAQLADFMRDLALLLRLDRKKALGLTGLDGAEADRISGRFKEISFHLVMEMLHAIIGSMNEIHQSGNQKLSMELLLMRLASMSEVVGMDELIGKVNQLLEKMAQDALHEGSGATSGIEKIRDGAANALKKPGQAPPSGSKAPQKGQSGKKDSKRPVTEETWQGFTAWVLEKRPSLGGALEDGPSVSIKEAGGRGADGSRSQAVVELSCSGLCRDILSDNENLSLLKGLASEYFGSAVEIRIVKENPGPAADAGRTLQGGEPGGPRGRGGTKRQQLINSPLVQEALELFQARISHVSLSNPKEKRYRK
jgi:DNA polymerase-3 subunit gamma/tau